MRYFEVSFTRPHRVLPTCPIHLHNNFATRELAEQFVNETEGINDVKIKEINNNYHSMTVDTFAPTPNWVGFINLGSSRSCRGETMGSYITTPECLEEAKLEVQESKKRQAESESAYYSQPWV